jgi:hypothetical protein
VPVQLRRLVTWGQGIEKVNHTRFSHDTGIPV